MFTAAWATETQAEPLKYCSWKVSLPVGGEAVPRKQSWVVLFHSPSVTVAPDESVSRRRVWTARLIFQQIETDVPTRRLPPGFTVNDPVGGGPAGGAGGGGGGGGAPGDGGGGGGGGGVAAEMQFAWNQFRSVSDR